MICNIKFGSISIIFQENRVRSQGTRKT
ncbi:MAG: DUF2292 domain-containing protein [Okeania sp. SIO3I5]|nr:DUF2292 domain-containing protein [Okeania sp. SIO3I5]